jgi:hypothetical protein
MILYLQLPTLMAIINAKPNLTSIGVLNVKELVFTTRISPGLNPW